MLRTYRAPLEDRWMPMTAYSNCRIALITTRILMIPVVEEGLVELPCFFAEPSRLWLT